MEKVRRATVTVILMPAYCHCEAKGGENSSFNASDGLSSCCEASESESGYIPPTPGD